MRKAVLTMKKKDSRGNRSRKKGWEKKKLSTDEKAEAQEED